MGGRGSARGVYYGWAILLTLSVTETTSWGILYYAFAVILTPMTRDLGWSRAQVTGAFSLALLLSGVAGLPIGRWLDRRGARLLMSAGSILATAMVFAWSRVHGLVPFYLIWAGIGLAMAAVLYEPAFAVVATWFVRRRRQALTILTLIAGLASVIFTPLTNWLVHAQGWREALVTLTVILGVVTILPHGLVLRRRPQDLGLLPDGADTPVPGRPVPPPVASVAAHAALTSAGFWALTVAFILSALTVAVMSIHFIPYLIDRGYAAGFAATAAGLIGLMQLPGRVLFTPLSTWLPRRAVTVAIFLMQGLALLVLLHAVSTLGVLAYVVIFGMGNGMITLARATLIAEFYGPANYASINSVVVAGTTLARAAGPVGAGLMYGWFQGYTVTLWALVAGSALAGIAALVAETIGPMVGAEPAGSGEAEVARSGAARTE
ncbi:MAG TPA: MFS transporter [Thermomicrobiaceae bacterium]|nr:MFS transporter [Thermomicrobiaceae bacterium]